MFPLSPSLWMAVGAAVLIAALSGAVYVQTNRLDAVRTEYATFKAEVKATGEAAQKLADARTTADKLNKEKTDAKHKRAVADLSATVERLRNERAGSHIVPPAPAGSRSPEIAAFERTQLDGALSSFVEGTANLVAEGNQATLDLDTVKAWAR